MTEETQLI